MALDFMSEGGTASPTIAFSLQDKFQAAAGQLDSITIPSLSSDAPKNEPSVDVAQVEMIRPTGVMRPGGSGGANPTNNITLTR